MAGGKEVQLSAEVDLLPSEGDRAASRQQGANKPPISMNFEVCSVCMRAFVHVCMCVCVTYRMYVRRLTHVCVPVCLALIFSHPNVELLDNC